MNHPAIQLYCNIPVQKPTIMYYAPNIHQSLDTQNLIFHTLQTNNFTSMSKETNINYEFLMYMNEIITDKKVKRKK